jgi:hypothetical protein
VLGVLTGGRLAGACPGECDSVRSVLPRSLKSHWAEAARLSSLMQCRVVPIRGRAWPLAARGEPQDRATCAGSRLPARGAEQRTQRRSGPLSGLSRARIASRDRTERAANRLDRAAASMTVPEACAELARPGSARVDSERAPEHRCAPVRDHGSDDARRLFQTCDCSGIVRDDPGKRAHELRAAIMPRGRLRQAHTNASLMTASERAARASRMERTPAKFAVPLRSRGKRCDVLNGSRQVDVCGRLSNLVWLRSSPRTRTASNG